MNVTVENVVEVSENLTQIVSNVTLTSTDIVAATSVVTKIVNSLNGTNENEVYLFWVLALTLDSSNF